MKMAPLISYIGKGQEKSVCMKQKNDYLKALVLATIGIFALSYTNFKSWTNYAMSAIVLHNVLITNGLSYSIVFKNSAITML